MKEEKEVKICCTWKDKIECNNCKIEKSLNCRYSRRKWLFFILNQMPARFFAIFGLVVTGLLYHWWPLIVYGAIAALFIIFGLEVRVVCTHCPHYSSESKMLRCLGLTGTLKIWKYRPEPIKKWETAVEASYFFLMLGWPVGFEVYLVWLVAAHYSTYGLYTLLGIIAILAATILASLQFAYILKVDFCSNCVNFSCALNTVPKEIVDAFLARNPVMREAWEKSGYKLGKDQQNKKIITKRKGKTQKER